MDLADFLAEAAVEAMSVQVEAYTPGDDDPYGIAVTLTPTWVEQARAVERRPDGDLARVAATVFAPLGTSFPDLSRITLPSGAQVVLVGSEPMQAGGTGAPEHTELTCVGPWTLVATTTVSVLDGYSTDDHQDITENEVPTVAGVPASVAQARSVGRREGAEPVLVEHATTIRVPLGTPMRLSSRVLDERSGWVYRVNSITVPEVGTDMACVTVSAERLSRSQPA